MAGIIRPVGPLLVATAVTLLFRANEYIGIEIALGAISTVVHFGIDGFHAVQSRVSAVVAASERSMLLLVLVVLLLLLLLRYEYIHSSAVVVWKNEKRGGIIS